MDYATSYQSKDAYQSIDTVLNALMVGGLGVAGAVMVVVTGAQALVA